MNLPLHLQMEIDISAASHKREVAEGFTKLREKLLPPPRPSQMQLLGDALRNQTMLAVWASQLAAANPPQYSPLALANAGWNGAWTGIGGLGTRIFGTPFVI